MLGFIGGSAHTATAFAVRLHFQPAKAPLLTASACCVHAQSYRTSGGSVRLRDLPLCPLTNFADELAREEICEIVPGVYQSNWRGAEKVHAVYTRFLLQLWVFRRFVLTV